MLFVQVILFGVFTLPQNIQKFISYAQSNEIQSALNTAIGNFIFNFFLLFAYLANGISFYIYTLFGGSVFRDELLKLAQGVCRIF
jgi:Na+/pantothenate symporter